VVFNSSRDATILMIQWVLWKHLSQTFIMDAPKMQQLVETLAYAFYDDGVRMPLDDDPETTPIEIQTEVAAITFPCSAFADVPRERLQERCRIVGRELFKRGWRKFSDVAA
jgi:hypothetical protein